MVADGGTEDGSFAEKLVDSGRAVEPANRFEDEEMGTERELLRHGGADADQALRWHMASAVVQPDSAIDCTGL
jgi:hypothetical protein